MAFFQAFQVLKRYGSLVEKLKLLTTFNLSCKTITGEKLMRSLWHAHGMFFERLVLYIFAGVLVSNVVVIYTNHKREVKSKINF